MTREQFVSNVEASQEAFRRFLTALCCGDTALADDLAQEAYLKAYLSISSNINIEKFRAWIFKIGYNTFINHKRSERYTEDYLEATAIASTDSADSSFAYQDLYEALNKIPPRERSSLLLFYMQGYSIKEIAEIQDISQEAVKQHLFRGRNHLRLLLTKN